jgi:hypothetical protein
VKRLVVAACVLALSACGVSSQDEPQLIEESTPPTATPSFDNETSPSPSTVDTSPALTTIVPPGSAPDLSDGVG